ncbi:DUF4239 domain-containing protein [Solihabitans fulvus]|uniref:DUF4239 domain-containing protein n=1 Tax=Solihabitans fulvus TaxID=1892852 RepID=A0A5B2WNC7_9PSEU|nr:DUF4239 domain-containing protein [Solihabitans fulvus]KAA2252468.1 DUF4239 domain-containing protein [Solihabitans fulvus]
MPVALLVLFGAVILSVSGTLLIHRCSRERSFDHNALIGYFLSAVGAFYSFLLAFVVVSAWSNMNATQNNIYDEASALPGIYYDSTVFPEDQQKGLQKGVIDYAQLVISDEWPAMGKGGSSAKVDAVAGTLRKSVLSVQPQNAQQQALYSVMLGHLSKLNSDRRWRLNRAQPAIPPMFWAALVGGGVAVGIVPMFFHARRRMLHAALMATLNLMVAASLLLAHGMDQPFAGIIQVEPDAFRLALVQMGQHGP